MLRNAFGGRGRFSRKKALRRCRLRPYGAMSVSVMRGWVHTVPVLHRAKNVEVEHC